MAVPTGFEPVTFGLGNRCSILLSYGTTPGLSTIGRPGIKPRRQATRRLAGATLVVSLAATGFALAGSCDAPRTEARVAAVLDDLDLALDDGRELRLAGFDPARATASRPGLGDEVRQQLSTWLSGRTIQVLPLAAPDRWDRTAALAWAEDGTLDAPPHPAPTTGSVAEVILAAGLGRVRPEPQLPSCFSAFRTWEGQARASGLGLWSDPYYAILDADARDALAQRTGAMALVEGRVSLGVGRARTFLRLGHGSGSFAATLSRRAAKVLAKAGLDPGKLAGRRVRIRGFLDDRFGPQIDITSADQIEVLDGAGGVSPAADASE